MDKKINKLTEDMLVKYENNLNKDNDFEKRTNINYYEYMQKQKAQENADKNKKNSHIEINKKNVSDMPLSKYSFPKNVNIDKNDIYKQEDPYVGIEKLEFDEENEGNYEKVNFRFYDKENLKQLFEIDKKLESLNPKYQELSTKNHLKNIKSNYVNEQKELQIKQKEIKEKENNNKIKAKPSKYEKEKPKKAKEKVVTDYLTDLKINRELKQRLNDIDQKIITNQRKEYDEKKIENFIAEFNSTFYNDPEQRKTQMNFRIPEELAVNKMTEMFENCEKKLKDLKENINEYEKSENEKFNKPRELTNEEINVQKRVRFTRE